MRLFIISILFAVFLFAGCQTNPKAFSLGFTIESVNVYSLSVEIDKDRNYRIRQQSMLAGNIDPNENDNTSLGIISEEDYAKLSELIAGSRVLKMKNNYGIIDVDSINPDEAFSEISYHFIFREGRKNKHVAFRLVPSEKYPEKLIELIFFLSDFISTNL